MKILLMINNPIPYTLVFFGGLLEEHSKEPPVEVVIDLLVNEINLGSP